MYVDGNSGCCDECLGSVNCRGILDKLGTINCERTLFLWSRSFSYSVGWSVCWLFSFLWISWQKLLKFCISLLLTELRLQNKMIWTHRMIIYDHTDHIVWLQLKYLLYSRYSDMSLFECTVWSVLYLITVYERLTNCHVIGVFEHSQTAELNCACLF